VTSSLAGALAALEEAGVPVAVLRGFEPDGSVVEIDLLVAVGYERELHGALVRRGFAPLRAWGHGGHRFYLGYAAVERLWLKLDFVTEVAGADTELVLAGRRRVEGLPRLEPDVEAALLLLHCIVDKGGRLGRHATTLRRLATARTAPPPGAHPKLTGLWSQLEQAVAAPKAAVPDALVRSVVDLVAPDRTRDARRDRWLRRASYLRRMLRPAAPTVVVMNPASNGPHGRCERLVRELGPGARRMSLVGGRGPLAPMRRRLAVELERRKRDGPIVLEVDLGATGLPRADVEVTPFSGTGGAIAGGEHVAEAVWRAYRRQLVG
jgi:hypothetical protein